MLGGGGKAKGASGTKTKAAKTTDSGRQLVVQMRRGVGRPEDRVPVTHLEVPDLWHSFGALERVASEIREDNPTQNVVVDARARTLERVNELAKKTWDVACDMKKCLQETISPAISEAIQVLDGLKAESEIRKLDPDDLQRAIVALEKAFKDGQGR